MRTCFMGASCKGLCVLSNVGKIPNSEKYQFGLKRCSWCEVWLKTNEIRCMCCKMILRTKSRNKKKSTVNDANKYRNSTSFAA